MSEQLELPINIPGLTLDEIERQTVLLRLITFDNNKSKTAKSLGITTKTLYNRLEKYGVYTKGVKNG